MSKLNSKSSIKKHTRSSKMTTGEIAGQISDSVAAQDNYALLRRAVLANLLWENIAYMDGKKVADEIKRLIPLCDPEDVANLAVESRQLQKLRHTPLFIVVEMCRYEDTRKYMSDILPKIITRPDMLTDFLALYWKDGKCPICKSARKGLQKAFSNFNEYQFSKYDRNAPIKLRDVMFMVHPKPNNKTEEDLFNKIANRTLKTPETWEVLLSYAKSDEEKAAVWTKLINENKLGGKAMLMNLRNMQNVNVPRPIIQKGINNLHSKMLLPLDFVKAYRQSQGLNKEIEEAMITSYANLPKLPGKTLFIIDVSGSMGSLTSKGSRFSRLDQACAQAMLAVNQCEDCTLVCTAGNDSTMIEKHEIIKYPSKGFDLCDQIINAQNNIGYGGIFTNQCLKALRQELKGEYDRIIIFSDSQDIDVMYGSQEIPQPFGKYNYICDISCHTRGINYNGVWTAEISGWSEHFLTYIASYEGLENKFNE